MLKASALYYRTKPCVHNYTVYNVTTRDVCCYVWNESERGLSANEYASCIIEHLKGYVGDYDNFIIFFSRLYRSKLKCYCNKVIDLTLGKVITKISTNCTFIHCHQNVTVIKE